MSKAAILCTLAALPLLALYYAGRFAAREARLAARSVRSFWCRLPLGPLTGRYRRRREKHNAKNMFTRLPGELRNNIYDLLAPTGTIIEPLDSCWHLRCEDLDGTLTVTGSIRAKFIRGRYMESARYSPEEWRRIVSMTQACRGMREETIRHFYSSNMFAFHRRRDHYDKSWYEMERAHPKYLEHWLQSRPPEALPFLKLVFISYTRRPGHPERQDASDALKDAAWILHRKGQCIMTGEYLVMLDFASSRHLRLVKAFRSHEWRVILHDCPVCLQHISERWRLCENSDQWRAARDRWHDRLDAGTLSWKDALHMIDVIRDWKA